jgi:hypothetical protein
MSARSVGSCPGRRGAGTRREAMRAETTINMLKELQGRAARFHRVRCKRPKERVGYPRKPIIHSAPSCYRAGSTPPRLRSAAGRPAPVGVGCTASAHTSVSATAYVVGAATTAQSPTVPPRAQATVAACYRPRQHPACVMRAMWAWIAPQRLSLHHCLLRRSLRQHLRLRRLCESRTLCCGSTSPPAQACGCPRVSAVLWRRCCHRARGLSTGVRTAHRRTPCAFSPRRRGLPAAVASRAWRRPRPCPRLWRRWHSASRPRRPERRRPPPPPTYCRLSPSRRLRPDPAAASATWSPPSSIGAPPARTSP